MEAFAGLFTANLTGRAPVGGVYADHHRSIAIDATMVHFSFGFG